MCGIIAYIGGRPVVIEILIKGLSRLEYRGYDSAGVFVAGPSGTKIVKSQGNISGLTNKSEKIRLQVQLSTPSTGDNVKSCMVVVNQNDTMDQVLKTIQETFREEYSSDCSELTVKGLELIEYDEKNQQIITPVKMNSSAKENFPKDMLHLRIVNGDKGVPSTFPPPSSGHFVGVGHTRWATHGKPTETNSHPHISNNGKLVVVHNGVIENYHELKQELSERGFTFYSETDTEVIPNLIEYYLKTSNDVSEAIIKATTKLKGAYACAILSVDEKRLYGIKLGSPMCIGISEGEFFIASEPTAFLGYTNKIIDLEDHEFVTVQPEGFTINKLTFDAKSSPMSISKKKERFKGLKSVSVGSLAKRTFDVPYDIEEVRLGKWPHFMKKEIYDQPNALLNTIGGKIRKTEQRDGLDLSNNFQVPKNLRGITFLACGTSWHAGLVGQYLIETHCGIRVDCQQASEYISKRCLLDENDLVIAISQSGQSADTRIALEHAVQAGAQVAGIVNVVGSQIANLAKRGIYLHAGPEIGVASTKAFSCQLAALLLLTAYLTPNLEIREQIRSSLEKVPAVVRQILDDPEIERIVTEVSDYMVTPKKVSGNLFETPTNALYLGRGIDFPVALEGALKLKEISYIHAEGIAAGEMKHGPIALIDEFMPCFFVVGSGAQDNQGNFQKVLANMQEVKARKGVIITITDVDQPEINKLSRYVIKIPFVSEFVAPILKNIPLQLIAYQVAVKKGFCPDKPRNLAKSVTV